MEIPALRQDAFGLPENRFSGRSAFAQHPHQRIALARMAVRIAGREAFGVAGG
jgi:hypothetical protein